MAMGEEGLDEARKLVGSALRRGEESWFLPVHEVKWLVPVEPPTHFLCAGRNFRTHRAESVETWGREGIHLDDPLIPTGFVKLPGALIPDGLPVTRPPNVTELDYEVEVAGVIGKPVLSISEKDALRAVFGYTVFNDLSARDWQRREMRSQMLLLGKNFPGFGPTGPWILTADEVSDPSAFTLELRVNGQVRQHASASDMIFGFPELVSFWSQIGLQPGDLIASGTPEGVAMHHKPDPFEWYLKPGDRVEAEVQEIGVLHTEIR